MSQLVQEKNQLTAFHEARVKASAEQRSDCADPQFGRMVQRLNRLSNSLQRTVRESRLQSVEKLFNRFPRMVRELARELDKEIDFVIEGGEIRLDKQLLDALAEPLMHLIRNAIDHGIESPERRMNNGKNFTGRLTLMAQQQGDYVEIVISDDGAGINREKLLNKAVVNGLVSAEVAATLEGAAIDRLVFLPGLSSAEQVSNISGRGVGMDVVKTCIDELGGVVEIDSVFGKGVTFRVKLPATMMIASLQLVRLADSLFALPLSAIREICSTRHLQIDSSTVVPQLQRRGETLSLYCLTPALTLAAVDMTRLGDYLVVLRDASESRAILVDKVLQRAEMVVKPLGSLLRRARHRSHANGYGISGVTVTGSGELALVLDLPVLMHQVA
ncbi:MAG: chemotaxis protein CheW [Gammaproteobacteria bacterium]|nr:chemotaxis protein CheW [Gammaproteobacteria bacterium]